MDWAKKKRFHSKFIIVWNEMKEEKYKTPLCDKCIVGIIVVQIYIYPHFLQFYGHRSSTKPSYGVDRRNSRDVQRAA
jgi:hypothetical protein